MKSRLLLIALLTSFTSFGQVLNYDGNDDGCVDVNDMLGLLIEYGQCLDEQEEFMCGDNINHEGYNYSTVQIGDQCWFSENCRYLPVVSPSIEANSTDPYYYVYGYEGTDVEEAKSTDNYAIYGVLYNWPAVMTEGVCPSGWHIPTDLEWQTMEMALGLSASEASSTGWRGTDQGSQMKSTTGWDNTVFGGGNGSNSSGFNGLPGGLSSTGGFTSSGLSGYWWSSSASNDIAAWVRRLENSLDGVLRYDNGRYYGFPARCIRD